MSSLPIPSGPAELTAPWLEAALVEAGVLRGTHVTGVDVTPIGEGVLGQLFRVALATAGEPSPGPRSVVVKLPARAASSVELCVAYQFYRRELEFYRRLPAWIELPIPRFYYGQSDAEGRRFALVFEDLSNYRVGNQAGGGHEEQYLAAVDLAARMHAQAWGRVAPPAAHADWVADGRATHVAPTTTLYGQSLPHVLRVFGERFSPAARRLAERVHEYIPTFWEQMSEPPVTLVHGDFRLENLLFGTPTTPRELCVVDFQLCVRARAGFDLGYLMSQSAPVALRRQAEPRILDCYHAALLATGVRDYDRDAFLLDYRRSTLYGLCYPIIVCGALDASTESARAFGAAYLERSLSAIDDWKCAELL